MTRTVMLLGCLVALTGCATSLMSQEPVRRSVTLAMPAQRAWAVAVQSMGKLGAEVRVADAESRTLSGVVHGVVVLNVRVSPQSVVEVTGTVLPGKMVLGSLTEVDQYVALLQ